jgi:hypothetical protein
MKDFDSILSSAFRGEAESFERLLNSRPEAKRGDAGELLVQSAFRSSEFFFSFFISFQLSFISEILLTSRFAKTWDGGRPFYF